MNIVERPIDNTTPQQPDTGSRPPKISVTMYCFKDQIQSVELFKEVANDYLAGLVPSEFYGEHEYKGVKILIAQHTR